MKTIGKYQIKGLLGKGGMGRVYKAVLPEVEKIVALKHLTPHEHMQQLLGKEQIDELFFTEARVLGNINHPHVAGLLDFDYDQSGRPFFVMEYLCMNIGDLIGESYDIEKPSRLLPPERAIRYMDQTLAGLDRLHAAGIIHRDIKPYNILLTDDDRIKIIDLGLSRLRGEVKDLPETFKIGTPYYAPPEQETSPDKTDERSDLYSAAVMAWRMLTGTLPPEFDAPPAPSRINPLLGDIWDKILRKGIDANPARRFQNCTEMREALNDAFAKWRETVEQTCQWMPPESADQKSAASHTPRKTPLKVLRDGAQSVFGLDKLHRPAVQATGDFYLLNAQIVRDKALGLIWQPSGSPYPLDWDSAQAYIDHLNKKNFGEIDRWRLPTVDELLTLIEPKSVLGDYCQPSIFDNQKNRLWSSDTKSFTAAWYVHTEMGYVDSQDRTCRFYVRGVADT
ncbi:MAG TPA: protein kinase [Desulfosalsimonadaceae bacterium]|nr:protein kinase [Desulfosalsimonadaceae bacterium]